MSSGAMFFKEIRDGQSAVSLSVSVSLFWRENDADNLAKRLSASFFVRDCSL